MARLCTRAAPYRDLPCPQVFVPLIAHCIRHQVSEDRPGGHHGLGLTSARTLGALGGAGHAGMNAALSALLTPGGLSILRRSPEELVCVLRTPTILETPRLVWGPHCREELEEMLQQVGTVGAHVSALGECDGTGPSAWQVPNFFLACPRGCCSLRVSPVENPDARSKGWFSTGCLSMILVLNSRMSPSFSACRDSDGVVLSWAAGREGG